MASAFQSAPGGCSCTGPCVVTVKATEACPPLTASAGVTVSFAEPAAPGAVVASGVTGADGTVVVTLPHHGSWTMTPAKSGCGEPLVQTLAVPCGGVVPIRAWCNGGWISFAAGSCGGRYGYVVTVTGPTGAVLRVSVPAAGVYRVPIWDGLGVYTLVVPPTRVCPGRTSTATVTAVNRCGTVTPPTGVGPGSLPAGYVVCAGRLYKTPLTVSDALGSAAVTGSSVVVSGPSAHVGDFVDSRIKGKMRRVGDLECYGVGGCRDYFDYWLEAVRVTNSGTASVRYAVSLDCIAGTVRVDATWAYGNGGLYDFAFSSNSYWCYTCGDDPATLFEFPGGGPGCAGAAEVGTSTHAKQADGQCTHTYPEPHLRCAAWYGGSRTAEATGTAPLPDTDDGVFAVPVTLSPVSAPRGWTFEEPVPGPDLYCNDHIPPPPGGTTVLISSG